MYASIFDPLSKLFAWPLMRFYAWTGSYAVSIMLITIGVMLVTTPLTLKSTKGMLEMQRLQPELKKLQNQYRGDRQKLNEEMMKLYQEHKVNPLASCFPLLLQMPVFIGMFHLLRNLTQHRDPATGFFLPKTVETTSKLYKDLSKSKEMLSWALDLAKSPAQMLKDSTPKGILYITLVVILAILYWVQQRMVANRTVSPTMSPAQAKLMQYLPVSFAVFQIFFPLALVLYYAWQTILRIVQQHYVTRRFYHGEGSLGHQAAAAGAAARELSKGDKAAKTEARPKGAGAASRQPAKPAGKPAAGKSGRPSAPQRTASGKPIKPTKGQAAPARPTKPVKPIKPVKPTKPTKPQN